MPKTQYTTVVDVLLSINTKCILLLFLNAGFNYHTTSTTGGRWFLGIILAIPYTIYLIIWCIYKCKWTKEYDARTEQLKKNGEGFIMGDWYNDDLVHCAHPSLIEILS